MTAESEKEIQQAVLYAEWVVESGRDADPVKLNIVDKTLRTMAPDDLLAAEHRVRRYWYSRCGSYSITPSDLPTAPSTTVKIHSWHPNGHFREAALRVLSEQHDTTELIYLIIRMADWTEQVRTIAINAVRQRITEKYALDFSLNLGLLKRIRERSPSGSQQHVEILDDIAAFVTSPLNQYALSVGLRSPHASTRKEATRLMLSDTANASLLLRSKDNHARKMAANWLANSDAMGPFVKDFLRDKQSSIRAIALEWFRVHRPTEAPSALQAALLDKSASLREYARYWVQKTDPNFDVREFYLEQLQSEHKTAQAIAGLGETGTREDVVQLLLPLESSSPRVVAMAIIGIGRLDGANYIETLLPFTVATNASIRKAAAEALVPLAANLNVAELCMAFANHDASVQRTLLRILRALPKWDRLGCALYALEHASDAPVRDFAGDIIRTWTARNHTEWAYNLPSPQQWARIMMSWQNVREKLPEATETSLSEVIAELQKLVAARSG